MRNEKGRNKTIIGRLLFLSFLESCSPYPPGDSCYFLFTLSCITETNKNYTPFINTQLVQRDHKLFDGNSLLIFFYTSYPFYLLEICTVKGPVCQFCWPTRSNYSHVTIESFKDSSCKSETGFFFQASFDLFNLQRATWVSGYHVGQSWQYYSALCNLYLLDGGANDYLNQGIIYTAKVLRVHKKIIYWPGWAGLLSCCWIFWKNFLASEKKSKC